MSGRLPSGAVNAPQHSPAWYLAHLRSEVAATTALLAEADPATMVPACPEWSIAQLVDHVGAVFGWANAAAASGERPPGFPTHTDDDPPIGEWFATRAATLIATLEGLDPDGDTWHHWPTDRLNRVWQRRMAHEMAVHRWDLETALRPGAQIDAELASDGIDEFLDLYLRRTAGREGTARPSGDVHLHCTDVEGEWLIALDDDGYHLVRAHQKGAAALRGPAEALLLWCWGRLATDDERLSPVGDDTVLTAWHTLMGA